MLSENTLFRWLTWWILYPAHWWQFYFPQSGFVGGVILGSIVYFGLISLSKFLTGAK